MFVYLQVKVEKQTTDVTMNDINEPIESQTPQKTPPTVTETVTKSPSMETPVTTIPPAPTGAKLGEKDLSPHTSSHIIKTDPRYRNPFKFGWRREVVFRANMQNIQKSDNKGEVYYHSPSGKKLRTKAEILSELRTLKVLNLDIGDFSFAKESIGMPADQEIVRSAKIQTPSLKRQSSTLPETVPTPEILGKRIPKPKMPKGASPPPPSIANKSRVSLIAFINNTPDCEFKGKQIGNSPPICRKKNILTTDQKNALHI